jgi:2-phospho-L-lactate guanylyltransferase
MPDAHRADLDRLHVVVPLRTISGGKLRLGESLDAEERESLVTGMLLQTLSVLRDWPAASLVHVVSPDPLALSVARDHAAHPVHQADSGLNEALAAGRAAAEEGGASAVLVLPADLPLVSREALDGLLEAADAACAAGAGRPIVVLAPSDARGGTNALLTSPADAIEPCFGGDSLERHLRAAHAADATTQLVVDPALGFDLDMPEDLERLDAATLARLIERGAELTAPLG